LAAWSSIHAWQEVDGLVSWSEHHVLTVRMFEAANVARSERSIVNWCQANRQGIARLDAYYDPNERRYYITPQSVEAVIEEEKAKAARGNPIRLPHDAEAFGTRNPTESELISEQSQQKRHEMENDDEIGTLDELRREYRDLQITNRAKDMFIDQLKTERENIINQLTQTNRQIGVLETKLMQIEEGIKPDGRK